MQIQKSRKSAHSGPLGHRLLEFRKGRGLTQAEFATQIGVPKSTFVAWERGEAEPPARLFEIVRDAFGLQAALGILGLENGQIENGHSIDWVSFASLCEEVQKVTSAAGFSFSISDVVEIAGLVRDRHVDNDQGLRDVQQLLRVAGRRRNG
jgi:transcriptional regulator with XRE-family HTH domain